MASPVGLGNCLASDDGGWGQKLLQVPSVCTKTRLGDPLRPSAFSLYFPCGLDAVVSSASPVVACRLSPVILSPDLVIARTLGADCCRKLDLSCRGTERADDIAV